MLTHLLVKDFAIIASLDLDLSSGFSVITGETGAGKSIIIEAISLALGARADSTYVRTGSEKAVIELTVDRLPQQVLHDLEENGIVCDDAAMTVSREVTASGKSTCRINGTLVNVSFLNAICRQLCDIHGQYEHQSLLAPENHIILLDRFGGEEFSSVKSLVGSLYDTYAALTRKLDLWEKARQESLRKQDFMRYEFNEIHQANLQPGEDEALEEELNLLKNSEKIFGSLSQARAVLAEDEGDALSRLHQASLLLSDLAGFSPALRTLSEGIDSCSYQLEDLAHSLRREAESVTFSEERLNEVQERLEVLDQLKRKYGKTLNEVIAYGESVGEKLHAIEGNDAEAEQWRSQLSVTEEQLQLASKRLSDLRKRTAKALETQVCDELSQLNFKNAVFSVSFDEEPLPYSAEGTDRVEFLMSANKGEALRPLAKVASGGELSRIMLAFKRIVGDYDSIPTMIFDEIDTGISGITASIVGRKLKSLSDHHQILCITHLPQIAAFGDTHLRIEKRDDAERSITTLTPLSEEGRIDELARLTGGLSVTEATRRAAAELLQSCRG